MTFGTAFLPQPQYILDFKSTAKARLTKVNRLTGLTKIDPKALVLALDVVDTFADVLFKEEAEEAKEYIADILACPIWDDPEEWEEALKLNLSALQVGQKIESWIETKDNWEKSAKSITARATKSIEDQSDLVAEPDMEDALNTVEALPFKGSEKQIKWAKDIAVKNLRDVAIALKNNKQLPLSAKWWIDNRTGLNF
jgi:hypothetical protein